MLDLNFLKLNREDEPLWSRVACTLALNTALHPLYYSRFLMQIGHEPMEPYLTRRVFGLFGRPVLALPNVFQYVKHIKEVDGLDGCFRGLFPRLLCDSVYLVTFPTVSKAVSKYSCRFIPDPIENIPEEEYTDKDKLLMLWRETAIEITAKTVSIIVSYPLQVITWRAMAQFVGRETQYNGLFSAIAEIYRTEGILGFFSGLIPQLICGIVLTISVKGGMFLMKKIPNDTVVKFSSLLVKVVAPTFSYPFYVTSACMAVNNCGLAAGSQPQMPMFSSSLECYSHLYQTNQLQRGSTLLFRIYGESVTPETFWDRLQNRLQKRYRGIVNLFLFF